MVCSEEIQWEKIIDHLLILYVWSLTKKWSVYNLMVGLFETVRDRIIKKQNSRNHISKKF